MGCRRGRDLVGRSTRCWPNGYAWSTCRKALACAANALFRERCEAELASSMARAVEMHCRTLLDVQLSGTAAAAIDEASFFERSH